MIDTVVYKTHSVLASFGVLHKFNDIIQSYDNGAATAKQNHFSAVSNIQIIRYSLARRSSLILRS